MSKNKIKQEKAITLIALVVSIIVLLILAGVSIAVLTGENGILNRATEAKQTNEQKTAEEELKLGVSALSIDYRKSTTNSQTFREFVTSNSGANLKTAMGLALDNQDLVVENAKKGVISYKGKKYQVYDLGMVGEYVPVPNFVGLSIADGDAELPENVEEVELVAVQNVNLQNTTKIKAVIKGKNANTGTGEVPIPVNTKYVTGTERNGVVIEYKGSEFVWVPVPIAIEKINMPAGAKPMARVATAEGYASITSESNYEGILYDFTGSGVNTTSSELSNYGQGIIYGYREPDVLANGEKETNLAKIGFNDTAAFKSALIEEYKLMVESVEKYGGFYVGRYETSIDGNTVASKKSPDATTIKPMISQDVEDRWYGMYDKQKKFSTIGMKSSMIWGSQYDAMLNWMIRDGNDDAKTRVNGTGYGNHQWSSDVLAGCGTYNNGSDVINNIYDLEGNAYEWTLEAEIHSTYRLEGDRVFRGGHHNFYGTPDPPSKRNHTGTGASNDYGSRISLYIE